MSSVGCDFHRGAIVFKLEIAMATLAKRKMELDTSTHLKRKNGKKIKASSQYESKIVVVGNLRAW